MACQCFSTDCPLKSQVLSRSPSTNLCWQASFLGVDILMNPERIPPMVKDYYWDKQVRHYNKENSATVHSILTPLILNLFHLLSKYSPPVTLNQANSEQ